MDTGLRLIIGAFVAAGLALCAAANFTAGLIVQRTLSRLDAGARVAPMPVLPAIDVARAGPLRLFFAPGDGAAGTAPEAPSRRGQDTANPLADQPVEKGPSESNRAGACLFGGVAGTGAALVMGPAEIGALLASAAVVAPTAPLIGVVLGGAFVAGCAGTAILVPLLQRSPEPSPPAARPPASR